MFEDGFIASDLFVTLAREALMDLCQFKECSNAGCRAFRALGVIWLCEEHFHKCVIAAADLQAKSGGLAAPHMEEFQRNWLRERNLPEQWAKTDMSDAEFYDLVSGTRAEFNKVVSRELSRWLRENCKANE